MDRESSQKQRMTVVDRFETMLLGFASGALTGAACLAVLRRNCGNNCGNKEGETTSNVTISDLDQGDLTGHQNGRDRDCSIGGAPIFPPAGPLQQAGDLIHKIKSVSAAANASVAEFQQMITSDQLDSADSLMHQQDGHQQMKLATDAECGAASVDNDRLQQQLQAARDEAHHAQQQLAQAVAQLAAAQNKLSELHACHAGLQHHMHTMLHHLTELSMQVISAGSGHTAAQSQLQLLQSAAHSLQCQLQQVQAEAQQRQVQLNAAHQAACQQEQLLQQAQAAAQQRQTQLDEAHQVAQQQEQLLQQAQAEEQKKQAQLEKAHQSAQRRQQVLQQVKGTAEQQQAQLEEAQQAGRQQEQLLQQAQAVAQQKQVQLEEAKQANHHQQQLLQQVQSNLTAVKQEKQQVQQALEQAQAELQAAAAASADLQQQLETTKSDAAATQVLLGVAAGEVASMRRQLQVARADATAARQIVSSASREVTSAHQQLQMMARAKQELKASLAAAAAVGEDSYQRLQQLFSELQQQQQAAQASEQAHQHDLQSLQLELHAANASAAGTAQQVQELESELAQQQLAAQTSEQAHQRDLQSLQLALQAANVLAAERAQQVQELELRLAQLEQQLHSQQADVNAATMQQPQTAVQTDTQHQQPLAEDYTDDHLLQRQQMSLQQQQGQIVPRGTLAPLISGMTAHHPLLAAVAASTSGLQQGSLHHSSTAGKSEQELMQSYAGLMRATRRVGAPAVLVHDPLVSSSLAGGMMSEAGSSCHMQLSWLQAEAAAEGALTEAPASSLLDELQQESDELAEQLGKLQQYLKTSTSDCADLNSIEVMDEGLQVLQRLTHETVGVAASTVQRVTSSGAIHSVPTSSAGRWPSLLGAAPKLASCVGTFAHSSLESNGTAPSLPTGAASSSAPVQSEQVAEGPVVPPAELVQAARHTPTVAMRRLGLELPRLQSWGSAANLPDSPKQISMSAAGGLEASDDPVGCASLDAAPGAAVGMDSIPLGHWGSELSEAACSWLAGGLAADDELIESVLGGSVASSSAPCSGPGATATPAGIRVGSRLAAVSMLGAEHGTLDAWGSGMLPVSGAGSAPLPQQQQAQQQEVRSVDDIHNLLQSRPAESSSSPTLHEQLQSALAEVRQLQGERMMLRSQVVQLAELAAQQEDRLAVNDELLSALTTGLLENGMLPSLVDEPEEMHEVQG